MPIVVAVNKIDKADAQPDRVKQQLSDRGLMPEEWGGTTVFVNVSAKKRQNLEQLLEMILLVADLQELKANPKKTAAGTVLEARLDKGRGPVATVLVQDGTLERGRHRGGGRGLRQGARPRRRPRRSGSRRRAPRPRSRSSASPRCPSRATSCWCVTDSLKAQSIVAFRQLKLREKAMAASSKIKLEDLGRAIAEGQLKELPLVVKADVQGSVEAVVDQLMKLPQEKIKLRIIRSGAGAITEGDVLLAAASNAVVIGFNVRPERKAAETAERDKVDVRLYTVIYDAVEEMKKAMEGLLEPTIREVRLGAAEVRDTFKISKVGTIAGCFVTDGKVNRNAQVRLLRDNVVIHTGKVVVAEALQGRRQRGQGRHRVRHRHRELQRREARRRHRVLHHGEGEGDPGVAHGGRCEHPEPRRSDGGSVRSCPSLHPRSQQVTSCVSHRGRFCLCVLCAFVVRSEADGDRPADARPALSRGRGP